jgi:MFS family permease
VPAVYDVQQSLGASSEWATWLITIYLMVATVATPAMGRLGDLHGRRRMLLIGLAVFAIASVGAALSPDLAVLIVFRAVQGIGGAVYPLALAIARDTVPEQQTTRVASLLTGAFGIGTAIGFVGGGWLAQDVSWRAIFGAGAGLVVLALVAAVRGVPDTGDRAGGAYDFGGTTVWPWRR